jgi:hypothetical protein
VAFLTDGNPAWRVARNGTRSFENHDGSLHYRDQGNDLAGRITWTLGGLLPPIGDLGIGSGGPEIRISMDGGNHRALFSTSLNLFEKPLVVRKMRMIKLWKTSIKA